MSSPAAHILMVDDEPEDLGSLHCACSAQGWRTSVATSGQQGFHRAQALTPDLILLDVRMPGMDGFATCRLLKESARTRALPVIFLSSANDVDERLQGLEHGGVDYILKPFVTAEVVARIRIHLQLASSTRRRSPPGPMPLLSQGEIILRAAMRLISANLAQLPPLAEIARKVGTHDKKLSMIFREHLGMTVFAWVREERLRVSRDCLTDSHMSMQDIATEVGFRSAANFATAFRSRMGVTPSAYREHVQHDGPPPAGR